MAGGRSAYRCDPVNPCVRQRTYSLPRPRSNGKNERRAPRSLVKYKNIISRPVLGRAVPAFRALVLPRRCSRPNGLKPTRRAGRRHRSQRFPHRQPYRPGGQGRRPRRRHGGDRRNRGGHIVHYISFDGRCRRTSAGRSSRIDPATLRSGSSTFPPLRGGSTIAASWGDPSTS